MQPVQPPLSAAPMPERADTVTDYHGEAVADPYRRLEDTDAPETRAFIAAQNERTESFLAAIPERDEIRRRLTELFDYPKLGVPFERGGRWFQLRNPGLADQAMLFVAGGPTEDGEVLLDPNQLSAEGTVAISAIAVTNDGSLCAYALSEAGSDWLTWRVREVSSGVDRDDLVSWSKFSVASFTADGSGFYYNALPRPSASEAYLAESRQPSVMLHRLGTSQLEDEVVFVAPDEPEWLPHAEVSEDGRYLVLTIRRGTFQEAQIHVRDLGQPGSVFRPLLPDFSSTAEVITNRGSLFYLLTEDGADRGRVVAVDLDHPGHDAWREVIGERASRLVSVHHVGGRLLCHWLEDAHSALSVHDLEGSPLYEVELPGLVAVTGIEGRATSDRVYFGVTSFIESGALYAHDLATAMTTLVSPSSARLDPSELCTEQVFATSLDGTRVPIFLTHRRDVTHDGSVPTLLYGYGGFQIPVLPSFSAAAALFVERGGLYAVANLRGGGEYGRKWYDDGRLENKQHVFDDFAAAARYLVDCGWTRPARIAINGRSNGGLLVGACLTQHPELFGAAVPEVGVLDLLRFHKFTIGWAWVSDYGSPDDPEQYAVLRRYSPLHNIVPGTAYPPTLVMTGDHDDRVVPGHSLKFAATLQAAQGGDAPILLRVDTSAGHGMGKPTAKIVEERGDVLSFIEWALSL